MKAIPRIALTLLLLALTFTKVFGQGTSSKGTEFWTCFMDHISAAGTNGSQMVLYITSDIATTGTVSFTDGTASIPYTITANAVTFVPIPASQFLSTEGKFGKGIHITALKPVAVYAHIYATSVSGATLLIPVNTMGKDYISLNYTQLSNNNPSYSTFAVIATEDNTTVEITPTAALFSGKPAGTPFQITLNKGELYQGLSLSDLTGTRIKSISTTAGACKKIAVFSGSSKIGIGWYNTALGIGAQGLSSDNLFQQVYPTATWGKNFITVSLKSRNYDIYRIVLSKPATTVTLNGSVIPATSFTNGLYYEFTTTGVKTNVISADQPIQVVQYTPTQGQKLPLNSTTLAEPGGGDPEMIYLSPIEQGLDHVTLYSTGYYTILSAYINVVIPTAAASSFTIDGVSGTVFTPIAGTSYSFAQITTTRGPQSLMANGGTATSGTHNLRASQPFNAIAYGFGQAESYGYAAGTNLIDFNKFIALQNADGTSNTGSTTIGCVNAVYKLQMTLPYLTTNIKWDLKDGSTPLVDAAPVVKSTTVKGTTTLYTYEYGGTVTYAKGGDYAVVATVFNPFGDDCGSNEDIEFNFSIAEIPAAGFTKTDNCLGTENVFTDKTDAKNSTIKSYLWDFGDGTAKATTAVAKHTYVAPADYSVTLTVVNDNGCSNTSAPQIVHISKLPQAAFDFSKIDCATQAITFTDQSTPVEGTITNWLWDFGDATPPVTKTDNTPFTHSFTTVGTYTVTLKITTASGCISTTSKTVTVNPIPKVDFALPGVCLANATAQFTDATPAIAGKTYQYLWDFGDVNATAANPNTATIANPTHIFTGGGLYHVSLTITTSDNCAVTVVKDYTVTGLAKFTAPATACPNEVVQFTDQTDPSNTAATAWSWNFGGDGTANTQNPTHAFKNPGDYLVTLIVTGNNGCSVTNFTQVVHINASPKAGFTYLPPNCEGSPITFTDASTSTENTLNKWVWDFGDGSAPVTNLDKSAVTHTYAKAGTYPMTLTVTTVTGCTNVYLQNVIINPLPAVDFTLPTVCLTNSIAQFANITPNPVGKPYQYLWDFKDPNATATNPTTSASANPTHQFTAPGVYPVILTVITADGCSNSTIKNYTVTGKAKFTAPLTACPGEPVQFTDQTDPSNTTVTAWKWDFGGDGTSNTQNPQHTFTNPGDYTVVLTVSGNNGCSETNYFQKIHIPVNPTPTFNFTTTNCETQAITFIDASKQGEDPITHWIWDFGDGSPIIDNPDKASVDHIFTSYGKYTVKLTLKTSAGCVSATYPQDIVVHPLPKAVFTIPDACLKDFAQFFSTTSTIADGTESEFKYEWDFGDPNANAANPNTSTVQNPLHRFTQARDASNPYKIKLSITSKYGCKVPTPITQDFTVNGEFPTAEFSFLPTNTFCSSDDVLIKNNANVSFGKITKVFIYWDWDGDQSNVTPYTGSAAITGAIFSHNYGLFNVPGGQKTFKIRMIAYTGSSASCTSPPVDHLVTIKANPLVTVTPPAPLCQEHSPITIQTNSNGFTGTGTFSGPGVTAAGVFDPAKAGPGTFTLIYNFTSNTSCGYSTTIPVTVYPTPTVTLGKDQVLLEGGSLNLTSTANPQPLTYKWTMADGSKAVALDHDDVANPVASPINNVVYMLTVTSVTGCSASATVNITVLKAPVVPNTFTPNGDGVNDKWDIKYLDTYPNATIEIYNRTGSKLYFSTGYTTAWDGTYNGVALPVGTYYYIINPKNGRKVISGSVSIIR